MALKHLLSDTRNLIRISAIGSHTNKIKLCQKICSSFYQLNKKDTAAFVTELSTKHLESSSFDSTVSAIKNQDFKLVDRYALRKSLEPQYRQFFIAFGGYKHGIKFLVDLRKNILEIKEKCDLSAHNELNHIKAIDKELLDILSMWFSPNFLQFKIVNWDSPCSLLQKISEMEAVHKMRNWIDLKQRVGFYRRCFVFTHPCMVDPVTILHTALCPDLATCLQDLIQPEAENDFSEEDPQLINAAIFYSVSSPHKGLQGVDFGHSIITNAVSYIQSEFPQINIFSSLSPIPGFKPWLINEINNCIKGKENSVLSNILSDPKFYQILSSHFKNNENENKLLSSFWEMLQNPNNLWVIHYKDSDIIAQLLKLFCSKYLLFAKRPNGYALNPVCNFHLQNGAVIWKINWLGNTRPNGLQSSFGLMVNYRYFLHETENHRSNYIEQKFITASDEVQDCQNLKA